MTHLFDTNHAIAYLNADPRLASPLSAAKSAGDAFAVSATVLGELYYGAHASNRIAENVTKLAAFVAQIGLYDFDAAAAEEFGRIKAEQRVKGKPIPTADAQIAAVARLHGLSVLTNDVHLQFIENLSIVNWLVSREGRSGTRILAYNVGESEMPVDCWKERIVSTPDVLRGKLRIRNTRIPIGLILGYLAAGAATDQIIAEFPDLTADDIAACLECARDLATIEN